MSQFIHDFRALRSARQAERLERMSAFLPIFEESYRHLRRRRPADFNLFSLLRIQWDEVRHSRFLAWLLDTGASHGQGPLFLQAFVGLCGVDIPVQALDRCRVRTEFLGSESIVDIMLYRRGAFLIFVENKILAPEGVDQLAREFRDMRRTGLVLRVPEERQFAVFLTPTGRSPVSDDPAHWQALSYYEIAAAFKKQLPNITSVETEMILSDWVDTLSTFGGSDERLL